MAGKALPLALDNGFAAGRVARSAGARWSRSHRAQVGNDPTRVEFRKIAGGHTGPRDAPGDNPGNLVVGRGTAELTSGEVHASHGVAVGPMTPGATGLKQPT